MKQMNKRLDIMAKEPISKALFKLSLPAITGMLVLAVYNVVDTFFVSLLNDTTAIAATGIVFPIFQLTGAVGLTFGIGAASIISRRLGEDRIKEANETASTALYSALAIGLLFSLLGTIFTKPLLTLFGATDSILDSASLYGKIVIAGSIFQMLNMCSNNLLRSEGAALYCSIGQVLGAVLNIILDPIFIFVFNWGIAGAAIATVLSQCISTMFLFAYFFRKQGVLHPFNLAYFKPHLSTYAEIMVLGTPTLIQQILGSVSFAIVNHAAGLYGNDSAIAALSITGRLFSLVLMTLIGLAQGMQPLAGYNYGAKNIARVKETFKITFITTFIMCFVFGALWYTFATPLVKTFSATDSTVISMGTTSMRLLALALIPIGFGIMFGAVFQALGDGSSALILSAGQQGLILIPTVIILPRFLSLNGVFAAQPVSFTLAFVIGLFLFIKTISKLNSDQEVIVETAA